MQANPHLSIVIPTYNRADFLDYCLEVHIPLAKKHSIQIFIFDNASTDATAGVVINRSKEYPLIQYHCNETNIGPDENFERALKYPDTKYVWLLGDTYQIQPDGLDYLINIIVDSKQIYDVIVLNLADIVNDVRAQDFVDSNSLLCSLGALMTCLSCLIYNKELISKADFARYRDSSFIQTGIIFEAIARQSFRIHWAQSTSVFGLDNRTRRKNSWSRTPNVFNIACTNWVNFVFSLPVYYELDNKLKCIADLPKVSGILSIKHLLIIRSENILNIKTYMQYKALIYLINGYSKSTMIFVAIFPRAVLRAVKKIVMRF